MRVNSMSRKVWEALRVAPVGQHRDILCVRDLREATVCHVAAGRTATHPLQAKLGNGDLRVHVVELVELSHLPDTATRGAVVNHSGIRKLAV